jgi:hypothetical protein
MFKKIIQIALFTSIITMGVSLVNIKAESLVSISPYNANSLDAKNKNWFIFESQPGVVISDAFKIDNSSEDEVTLKNHSQRF